MTEDEFAQIVSAVKEHVAEFRKEIIEVMSDLRDDAFGEIGKLREEVSQTIEVLNGNDHAIIGALQNMRGGQVEGTLELAAKSWERYVRAEAEAIGLKVIVAKKGKVQGENESVYDPDANEVRL